MSFTRGKSVSLTFNLQIHILMINEHRVKQPVHYISIAWLVPVKRTSACLICYYAYVCRRSHSWFTLCFDVISFLCIICTPDLPREDFWKGSFAAGRDSSVPSCSTSRWKYIVHTYKHTFGLVLLDRLNHHKQTIHLFATTLFIQTIDKGSTEGRLFWLNVNKK